MAKLCATLLTYPYLVVKTRAQTKLHNVHDNSGKSGADLGNCFSVLPLVFHVAWPLQESDEHEGLVCIKPRPSARTAFLWHYTEKAQDLGHQQNHAVKQPRDPLHAEVSKCS